jgi:protein-S-isoprenylcysteine O-methyltransferase Ste14
MQTVWIAAVSFLAIIGFLALAILGEGGLEAFFARPPLIAVLIITLALGLASLATSGNLNPGLREDRANRWVLAAFALIGLLIAWLPAYTDRQGIGTIDGDLVRWIGVALYASGGVLRLWPVFTLGKRFSGLVAIQQDHRLVTTGLYSVVRHPSYLGMLIFLLGWALAFRSLAGVGLTALTIVPLIARIRSEEAMLASAFGAEYAAYRARTSRLIPGLY